jgi:predicted butyrate kinase (DUF1464 family)
MASRNPALPLNSHVQSHAEVYKNKLCDSHAALVARAIAGGWTRLVEGIRDRRLQGNQIANFPKNEYWRCRKIEDSSLMKRIYGRSNSRVFAPYGKV